MCEAGIPPDERRRAWPLLLSMRAPLLPRAVDYPQLRDRARARMAQASTQASIQASEPAACASAELADASAAAVIATDLRRTFPTFGAFHDGGLLHGRLQEVLWSYGASADAIAYRQGMSHLAAVLLLHVHTAPLACSCLSALLSGYPILRACGACKLC